MFYSNRIFTAAVCSDCTQPHMHPHLYIHVANLTLTEQVCAAAAQGGVNSTPTGLDDLQEEFRKQTDSQYHLPSCLLNIWYIIYSILGTKARGPK